MRIRLAILFLLVLSVFSGEITAQSGPWNPPNADLSFPRTLLKSAEIPSVQSNIAAIPEMNDLYHYIWLSAMGSYPTNTLDPDQRQKWSYLAKNAAFAYLIDRKWDNGTILPLSQTERDTLKQRAMYALQVFNSTVDQVGDFEEWLWRSRDIINYCTTYDLLRGAGVPESELRTAKRKLQNMTGDLHYEATRSILNFTFYNFAKNNHGLCTSAAFVYAAVVLNDADSSNIEYSAEKWANTGLWHINNIMWLDPQRQSDPVYMTGYAEGPHYFKVAFQNLLPAFKTLKHFIPDGDYDFIYDGATRTVRHPWYDPKWEQVYEWVTRIRMPDGRVPALDDSFNATFLFEMAILGQAKYHPDHYYGKLDPAQQGRKAADHNAQVNDLRADFVAANCPHGPLGGETFSAMPEAGNLIFRSSWDSTAVYMSLLAENGRPLTSGGGHNQADVTSFLIQAYGQILAMDPGYVSWTNRAQVYGPEHHNMILVDGAGPTPGQNGANGAPGYIENFFDTKLLDYGEARSSYLSADISRKVLFVRDRYFLLSDFVRSAAPHTYQWQLHGFGVTGGGPHDGTFSPDTLENRAFWTNHGVSLLGQVIARDGISRYDTTRHPHDINWNKVRYHNTLLASKSGEANTEFLAALFPFKTDTPQVEVLGQGPVPQLKYSSSGYTDLLFTQEGNAINLLPGAGTGLPNDLSSNAQLTFFSLDSTGDFSQLFMEEGSQLTYAGNDYVRANPIMDLAYQYVNDTLSMGYASASGTITLRYDSIPVSVWGPQVTNWFSSPGTNELTIETGGPTKFYIFPSEVVGREEAELEVSLVLYPNPTSHRLNLQISLGHTGLLQAEVLDLQGRLLQKWDTDIDQPGVFNGKLDISGLPVGSYFLRIQLAGKAVATKPFRVMR